MRAVICARVSSFRQAGNVSKDVQFEVCRAYVESQAGEVVAETFDSIPGTEGRYEERKGLHEALNLIEHGAADTVVVYDISRAARDDAVFARLLADIYSRRGRLAVAVERQVYPTKVDAEALLFWTKNASVWEVLTLKRRTQAAKKAALDAGSYGWRPLFGYKILRQDRLKVLAVDEKNAAILREIFSRFTNNESKTDITRWLHTLGVNWDIDRLTKVLRDADRYAGATVEFKVKLEGQEHVYHRKFPAIITAETCHITLNKLKVTYKPNRNPTPYLGVLYCTCGSNTSIARSYMSKDKTERLIQLQCNSAINARNRKRAGQTPNEYCKHSISAKKVTAELLDWLANTDDWLSTLSLVYQTEQTERKLSEDKLRELAEEREKLLGIIVSRKDLSNVIDALNEKLGNIKTEEDRIHSYINRFPSVKGLIDRFSGESWESIKEEIRGYITNKEWKKLNSLLSQLGITIVATLSDPHPHVEVQPLPITPR